MPDVTYDRFNYTYYVYYIRILIIIIEILFEKSAPSTYL